MSKFRLFVLIVILSFFPMVMYGENKEEIKLIPVYEKVFEDTIVDVIFDTATVSLGEAKRMGWKEEGFTAEDKAKGKVLVSYPRVVLVSHSETNELKFYDKNGRVTNRLVLKKYENGIHYSPNKKLFLVSRIPTEWNPGNSGGTLYDLDGNKIWEIEGPTPIAVSDEGYAVAAHLDWQIPPEPGGDFYVYDSKGKLITTIENPLKEKTAPVFAEYSIDGNYAILSFKACTYPPTVFVLITNDGRILWKKDLLEYRFRGLSTEIDINPSKGIVGIIDNGGKKIFFLDWRSNLRWVRPLNTYGTFHCLFSSNREKVYVCTEVGYLWCFNGKTGELIWMHKEPWSPTLGDLRIKSLGKGPMFTELYQDSQNIIIKGSPSTIFLFDSETGKLKREIEYPDKKIYLSPYNGKIFVINVTDKKIEGLKIEEE